MPLVCHLHQLEEDNSTLQGELTIAELELENVDELIHLAEPLKYDVEAQLLGRSVLVKGRLQVPLHCECVRCLKAFTQELELSDWTCLLELEGEDKVPVSGDSVDLTPYVREDILLALPQHPLCEPECRGLSWTAPSHGEQVRENATTGDRSDVWAALNKLKL